MTPTYELAEKLAKKIVAPLSEQEVIDRLVDKGYSPWRLLTECTPEQLRSHLIEVEAQKMWGECPKECHVCGSTDLYSPRGGIPFAFCESCGREKGYIAEDEDE